MVLYSDHDVYMSLLVIDYFLLQKCIVLDMSGTVWAAKQVILDKVYRVSKMSSLCLTLFLLSCLLVLQAYL